MTDNDELYLTLGDINVNAEGSDEPTAEQLLTEGQEQQASTPVQPAAPDTPAATEEKPAENTPAATPAEPEKTNTEGKQTPDSNNGDSSSAISVLANFLKEEGVFSSDLEGLDKVASVQDLKDLVAKQIANSRHSDLSDSQKRYLDSIESGLPRNEYEAIEHEIRSLEALTPDDLQNDQQLRFNLIVDDLIQSGLSEEKAVAMGRRSVELGKDIDDASEAANSIYERKIAEFQNKTKASSDTKQATLKEVQDLINGKEIVMGDLKLNQTQKDEIFKVMTTQVDSTEAGAPLNQFEKWRKENGLEAEIILNTLFVNTQGFKNLGTIKNEVTSSAAKQLEDKLKNLEKNDLLSNGGNGNFGRQQEGTVYNNNGLALQ